ncbi:MAG: sigma-70 family RNA polymerase sigma factor [Polyangiales bacterium]
MAAADSTDEKSAVPEQGDARRGEAEDLLERAARGDRDAVMSLYDRFAPVLLAVAMRIAGGRAEAEDIVQEVFARAWREAATFDRARGSAVAWLVTLTRNRAIDAVRSRKRRARHEDDQTREEPAVAPPSSTPELAVVDAERAAAVRVALESLRPEQRQVLELAYFSGLSHSEIAERLGQPLGTVKTRIAQAVKRLRDELSRFSPGDHGEA